MAIAFDPQAALESRAWPFQQAQALLDHLGGKLPEKGYVLFETGYGPSGLPHIGTFGEVVRTSMVRFAFEQLSGMPTKLLCVSDDMDGMRKIPDTIPNKQEYEKYMDLPLTAIPDPFATHESYGANMNSRLRGFLDSFGFDYEFKSATDCYRNGEFDEYLLKALAKYDEIMALMLPTLREERQKTYSPFLPVSPTSGKVLQVPLLAVDSAKGEITFRDEDGTEVTQSILGGKCKMQWKPDFGMRWAALDVNFEMYGKDHLANGPIYSKICEILGHKPPHQMYYELFLDEQGQKISKSKGNGISVEEWLTYATQESLALFMYQSPQKAKRLYFDVIPKNVDDYLTYQRKFFEQQEDASKSYANPLYYIHNSEVPAVNTNLSYSLLLNLVSVCNSEDKTLIEGYIKHAEPGADLSAGSQLSKLVECAMNYYHAFVKPNKKFRLATEAETSALIKLKTKLQEFIANGAEKAEAMEAEEIQSTVYAIGMESGIELKDWFRALYEVLLGAPQGPRFGSFIKLYGIAKTIELIDLALDAKLVANA